MQSIAAHIDNLHSYTVGLTAAENRYKTSRYVEEDKSKIRAKAIGLLNELAEAHRDNIDSAAANRTQERQKVTDQLIQEPDRVRLAWEAMQPLIQAGMTLSELARRATTVHDLGAIQVYGTAQYRAAQFNAQAHNLGASRTPEPSAAEKDLDQAILAKAQEAFGIDTTGVLDADVEAAMRSTWGALATGTDVPTEALTTIAVADADLYQSVKDAFTAKTGRPLGMEQTIAVTIAQRQAAALTATPAEADAGSSAA